MGMDREAEGSHQSSLPVERCGENPMFHVHLNIFSACSVMYDCMF